MRLPDVPVAEAEDTPVMPPGQVRRDAEPHRGPLLVWLAWAGLACGALSLLLFLPSAGAAALLRNAAYLFVPSAVSEDNAGRAN